MSSELIGLTAVALDRRVRAGDVAPRDVVNAAIERITATEPVINALTTRCFERALAQARALEDAVARTREWPLLAGIPFVVKDNVDVGHVRTSGGSPILGDRTPPRSDRPIAHLETNGGIPIAKSNLSELGGANTVNSIFGATRNPWNPHLTVGGSSGGSAAALASGQVWLAHGNDVGGSLRTPASFCGVVGLRTTPGRVARRAMSDAFDTIFVDGPMARNVADAAFMLDAMTGDDPMDPLSMSRPAESFLDAANRPAAPARIAVSPDLGCLPVGKTVRRAFADFVARLGRETTRVEETTPDFNGFWKHVLAIRGASYVANWGAFWPKSAARFTEDVQGDIRRGLSQSGQALADAQRERADLYRRIILFFRSHDLLICPAAPVQPFPVELPWPDIIDGQALDNYVDWIAITYLWSMTACPVLTVPVGFAEDGMPFGVQIVGPPRSEHLLMQIGAWIETLFGRMKTPLSPVAKPVEVALDA